jgi:carboxyl-terminal processing protease
LADIVVPGGLSQLEVGEKHAKFPVSTDEISSSLEDDFSDLSPLYRLQLQGLYSTGKQGLVSSYTPYLEILRINSKERIDSDKGYQNFLKELEKKDEKKDYSDFFGQTDFQLTECIHVMSDLIFLLSTASQ